MDKKLIDQLIIIYFASQTLCVIILLEMLILGKPFISLFLVIFAALAYFNLKLFGAKK